MKVRILLDGKKLEYDSDIVPVAIYLSENEKELIDNMAVDAHIFCSYPDEGFTEEEMLNFMGND
jgi:hypothetical protein